MTLQQFATKADLIEAYAQALRDDRIREYGYDPLQDRARYHYDLEVCRRVAEWSAVYAPHVSNLGWFIRGFGYSTERKPLREVFNPWMMERENK